MNNIKKSISAIGRRKTSIAKAFLSSGKGKIRINEKPFEKYFLSLEVIREKIIKPLEILSLQNSFNITIFVNGGGVFSQLEAISLAISKAIGKKNNKYRVALNKYLFRRSDSRIKERRKYGLKKARKASQYSKR